MGFGLYRLREGRKRLIQRWQLARAQRAVAGFPRIRQKQPSGLDAELIISLTSYPKRFPALAPTLRSLLDQRIAADRTILWIAEQDRDRLPAEVLALQDHGLDIRYCSDTRSYKKLIPCLQAFPDAWIVTADDDVYYPPDWLGRLVAARDRRHPATVAGRAHLARFDAQGRSISYGDWGHDVDRLTAEGPGEALFPTGVGGILYPPRCLHPDVTDESAFMALCPEGDDIWFFHMQRLAGTRQRRAPGRIALVYWPGSQEDALWLDNLGDGRNDRQIRALEARYGPLGQGLADPQATAIGA